jgi:hypothetical protein
MKYNTVLDYWQSATKQSFTVRQAENGDIIRTFFDDGSVSIRFISKQIGHSVVYSKTPLKPFERLTDIRDRGGNPVLEGTFYVQDVYPTLNPLGFSDGYSYKVAKVA